MNNAPTNSGLHFEVNQEASTRRTSPPTPLLMRALLLLTLVVFADSASADAPTFKVMSFNIWHGGSAGNQPLGQTAKAIQLADIAGLQETHHSKTDSSIALARQLGWHHFQQGSRTAVISRFPITAHTPNKCGVFVEVADDLTVCVFNCHLAAQPYQPYQLLNIPYGDAPFIKTDSEAIAWAKKARGAAVLRMLIEIKVVRATGIPCIITGDFNEPSHLDWTRRSTEAGVHPIVVQYPASKSITDRNFVDCYRHTHRDELKNRGLTWTPLTDAHDLADHHDRIDFVYASPDLNPINCEVVGESEQHADLVISPWPSDHRAVMATLQVDDSGSGD